MANWVSATLGLATLGIGNNLCGKVTTALPNYRTHQTDILISDPDDEWDRTEGERCRSAVIERRARCGFDITYFVSISSFNPHVSSLSFAGHLSRGISIPVPCVLERWMNRLEVRDIILAHLLPRRIDTRHVLRTNQNISYHLSRYSYLFL